MYLSPMENLVDVEGVRKAFPGVLALDSVSMHVRGGLVHALMGENGAGKSTLMKIVAGLMTPDAGTVGLRGRVAMIHQELHLMPPMTVAENIFLGREPLRRLGFIDDRALWRRTSELLGALGININPDDRVSSLTIAQRQMVEIARAVSFEAQILIMDEPTSALSEREVAQLFAIVDDLKRRGCAIIYITHKIDEVFRIADEVTVMRDGRVIASSPARELDRDRLVTMMVGRELTQLFPKDNVPTDRVLLSVRGLSLDGVFSDVSFDVRAGEILGIAGLVGSRRTELAETIFGVRRATSGAVVVDGVPGRIDSPAAAIERGLAFLTEDRKISGLFEPLRVHENMEVAVLSGEFVTSGFVRQARLLAACRETADAVRVKTPDLFEPVRHLSGGNQQKVLVGRWLLTAPRILILDEPTRGIDVGAKAEIHRLISTLAAQGAAVILISSEMPEILGMSDRVMVMRHGMVAGTVDRSDATQVELMRLAAH
ncbi:MAG TPA: sugar ABC transporter ATP-binding protein [Vicinamibacterales bacterium]|nr:sugar ABC transporter ATP-binding protein [Vicinamibacterales bacterium]